MSRWQIYTLLLILSCLGLTGLKSQAQSSSPDAMAVRAIYAKLEMASQLHELRDRLVGANATKAPIPGAKALEGSLHFVLSEVKTGSIDDIRSLLLSDLVTKPSGRKLLVTPSQWNFVTANGETLHAMGAQISWTQSPYLTEDWNLPISRLFDMGIIDPAYSRYASFTVRAIYQGEQRQYKALFLFSDDPEKQSTVFPVDHIIGMSALQDVSADQSLPEPLLAQPFRTRPEVSSFIEWWRGQPGCSTDAHTGMCCDPATGQCGVSSRSLQTKGFGAISSNVVSTAQTCTPPPVNCPSFNTSMDLVGLQSKLDTTGHFTGSHAGAVRFTGNCTYTGQATPCTNTCNVQPNQVALDEDGTVGGFLGCHVIRAASNGMSSVGGVPCSASWGYAVKGCALCLCSVSLSVNLGVGQVGVTSDGLYSWGWGATLSCPAH